MRQNGEHSWFLVDKKGSISCPDEGLFFHPNKKTGVEFQLTQRAPLSAELQFSRSCPISALLTSDRAE